jgi:cobaltochelatase CobN
VSRELFTETPLRRITRADGAVSELRVQDGHLFVCNGCCCRRTEKGFPALPLDGFKRQWKERGIRRRFHLTISGCLGPGSLANVVLILFRGHSAWFHSINSPADVDLMYDYVERMLLAESYLDPLADGCSSATSTRRRWVNVTMSGRLRAACKRSGICNRHGHWANP